MMCIRPNAPFILVYRSAGCQTAGNKKAVAKVNWQRLYF
ncbi:hypothetical protein Q7C_1841 [Methylophaga frappieri]|uniref:Uncharacterized protein n=1 Tax=Methylophaga frappieri (strain ATCC BAA-2434 / DSM 25690 / JAM7) TaxID=754477 RepID=I1YJ89_METFJ|nr:hypothetical protein Q7C_1841 [Methylophaga frappieri]